MKQLSRWSESALDLFNAWFVSDGGVWQTLFVCLVVVAIEVTFPRLDPHAFLLMAVLTVYSAITQPALARAGRVSGDRQEQMLAKVEALEGQVAQLVTQLGAKEDQEIALLESARGENKHG
jgi:hypothetical protein